MISISRNFTRLSLFAVVDSYLQFTYAKIGATGRCDDVSVYNRSNLADVARKIIYQQYSTVFNNKTIQAHVIADSARQGSNCAAQCIKYES